MTENNNKQEKTPWQIFFITFIGLTVHIYIREDTVYNITGLVSQLGNYSKKLSSLSYSKLKRIISWEQGLKAKGGAETTG